MPYKIIISWVFLKKEEFKYHPQAKKNEQKTPKNVSLNKAIKCIVFKLTLSTKDINLNILFIGIIHNNLKI